MKSAAEKAVDLLVDGRLMVLRVDPPTGEQWVIARCRGDSGAVYDLGYDPNKKEWRCSCPELKGRCSHLIALQRVVVIS